MASVRDGLSAAAAAAVATVAIVIVMAATGDVMLARAKRAVLPASLLLNCKL